jgi:hypothetical protein
MSGKLGLDEITIEFIIHDLNFIEDKSFNGVKKRVLDILDKVHQGNMSEIKEQLDL